MNGSSQVPAYFARKSIATRLVGGALLVIASPVILLLVLLVRCTSRGPALYRQTRTGRNGREFVMYKIRTMYVDAESVGGPRWAVPGDSRITPVGRILRLLHLDELPQLINVMHGEMDLVGPRPERPQFVAWLSSEIPNYSLRCRVLPGVTGLAQINLPPDETLDCVRRKLELDCQYIDSAGLGLDVRILLCTLLRMLGIRHGRAVRWLGLTYDVEGTSPMAEPAANGAPLRRDLAAYRPKNISLDSADAVLAVAGAGGRDDHWSAAPSGETERRTKSARPPR